MATCLFLLLAIALVADGFSPAVTSGRSSTFLLTKKNPQGAPITIQEDEDAAMWIEDKKSGKSKKALSKPVGGRPINKVTKEKFDNGGQKKAGWWPF